LRRATGRT